MFLVRLIYASQISEDFKSSDIEAILTSAQQHNKKNFVTGVFCFGRKSFLQCLEGSREAINETYHRILNDSRHTNIVLIDYQDIEHRDFDQWSMGYLPESKLTAPTCLKYSSNDLFDPYDMSGKAAHQFLLEIKEQVPFQ